ARGGAVAGGRRTAQFLRAVPRVGVGGERGPVRGGTRRRGGGAGPRPAAGRRATDSARVRRHPLRVRVGLPERGGPAGAAAYEKPGDGCPRAFTRETALTEARHA